MEIALMNDDAIIPTRASKNVIFNYERIEFLEI